ncbi:hypothetical protein [[Clostridium] scindens]|uniref:hypothetical protein n=1 Tax=Clostridium scindens (strain JCM 10418 / VPI 12708) TaxID=29347 RepID=UPI002ED186EB
MFRPLGITVERNLLFHNAKEQQAFNKATDISGWVIDSAGVNAAGWGLTLSPADMARIGQLYLNGGTWNGKRIVPEHWVRESTKEHSRWKIAIRLMDICGGFMRTAMRQWGMAGMSSMSIPRKTWWSPLLLFLSARPGIG